MSSFLTRELAHCGQGEPDPDPQDGATDYIASFKIRGLRGCVIKGGSEWELIQISFTQFGPNRGQISITADGWLAAGFEYPSDSQFTRSMQPEFAESLNDFAGRIAADLSRFKG